MAAGALPPRTDSILRSIVGKYIAEAVPVPSQSLVDDFGMSVSSATVRNEMARLEREGYIVRPHTSAGSIPSDKGYRHYVESLEDVKLPLAQRQLIDHVYHQVETRLEEWLSLTATLLAHLTRNMAVVAMPRSASPRFKHLELVSLDERTALLVLVIHGAKVRQQLVAFRQAFTQAELDAISQRLSAAYRGLTDEDISAKGLGLSGTEKELTECVVSMMRAEVEQERDEPYLDGLHFMLDQPEFAQGRQVLPLVELTEHRTLLKMVLPRGLAGDRGIKVIIGKENEAEAIQDLSVVVSQYGLPDEAAGLVAVIGPTRMPYARSIAAIGYLSWLLSRLIARLYGRSEEAAGPDPDQR